MEGRTITLPVALTAANSKELLRECRRTLYKEPLNLDGSALMRMDYSGDAFFALLADLSEKTGNKLTLAHFSEEIKAQLRARKRKSLKKSRRATAISSKHSAQRPSSSPRKLPRCSSS